MSVFQYKMTYRPFGVGRQPAGHTSVNTYDNPVDGCYVVVGYNRPLTEEEIYSFELTPCIVVSYEVFDNVTPRGYYTTIEQARKAAKARTEGTGLNQYISKVSKQHIEVNPA